MNTTLNLTTQRTYFGYKYIQRTDSETIPFFVFCARAKDIRQWVGIRRTKDITEGSQRVLSTPRQKAVTNFLKSDSLNTIPNSILIAFDNKPTVKFTSIQNEIDKCLNWESLVNGCDDQLDWGYLSFDYDPLANDIDRIALLVDGQHRLFGIADFQNENLPITTVALLNADVQEQAFQFIVINKKNVRVNTDNVKSIIAGLDEERLEERLDKAGVPYGDHNPLLRSVNDLPESPFRNILSWDYNRTPEESITVNITAIEQSFKVLRETFTYLEDDDDSLLDLFIVIWTAISESFPELWKKDKTFMRKVNINAMNEFIAQSLRTIWSTGLLNMFDMDSVASLVKNICLRFNSEFWTLPWSVKIQDNANVRDLIIRDLFNMTDNFNLNKNWKEGLKLVNVEVKNEVIND